MAATALLRLGALSGQDRLTGQGLSALRSVQVIMEDLTTDDLMRTFEALSVDFRLSLPYQARVVVVAEPADRRPPLVLRTRTEARL